MKHAICNEVYERRPFAEVCRSIKAIGYDGIEIAPFTLAEKPTDITAEQRREYRAMMQSEGLQFVGLHWIMMSPKGLHATTPDRELREKSWRHVGDLVDLCADLGENGIVVFGSPRQRGTTGGVTREDAMKNYIEGLATVASRAEERGVTILVEALPKNQCDVINSLEEAVSIVHQIGSPAVRTMFDSHNAVDEAEPHAELVDRYYDLIRHVHVNEMDGRHPGTGDYDFKPVFEVLRRRGYERWISLEAFDFTPGAETVASESLEYIKQEIGKLKT
ncbi:MAG TPA: sugar phosphate isomerase/epimerase family protein [Bryobacteraceae bacterium]|nr:sugar phosphate isomerase/epimerase family protein [Bryobacteraceae bacterium]